MKKSRLILSIFAIFLGALIFVYGGSDDSPRAQLLGFSIFIIGIVGVVKAANNSR